MGSQPECDVEPWEVTLRKIVLQVRKPLGLCLRKLLGLGHPWITWRTQVCIPLVKWGLYFLLQHEIIPPVILFENYLPLASRDFLHPGNQRFGKLLSQAPCNLEEVLWEVFCPVFPRSPQVRQVYRHTQAQCIGISGRLSQLFVRQPCYKFFIKILESRSKTKYFQMCSVSKPKEDDAWLLREQKVECWDR